MAGFLERLFPYLRVTRVSSAFAAVANAWFIVLWTRAMPEEPGTPEISDRPLWLLLGCSGLAAVGLFAFSACMNDLVDARRDRATGRDRPIAQGRLHAESGAAVAVLMLILTAGAAVPLGTVALVLSLGLAAGTLAYHVVGRFVPAIGLAMVGGVVAGHMFVPNFELKFVWPVWLSFSHVVLTLALAHAYGRKVPPLSFRAAIAALLGWAGWSIGLLALGYQRSAEAVEPFEGIGPVQPTNALRSLWPDWVDPTAAALPALTAVAFLVVIARKIAGRSGSGPRIGEKIIRYGTAWIPAYSVAWLLGIGAFAEAAIIAVLGALGVFGMATLREAYALGNKPVGYRL